MKIVIYSLIVIFCIFCILAIASFYLISSRPKLSDFYPPEKYLPEPYAGPEIHVAAIQGDIEIVRSILSEKPEQLAQTDKHGNSPLHLAAYKGHTDLVQFFISQGVNVNVRNNYGGTALLVASYGGKTEVVKRLIENGADANLAIKNSDKQVYQITSLEGYRDYSHMAMHRGSSITNYKVYSIASPLQAAAANGYIKIAEILIEKGADINAKPTGYSALHSAASNSQKELVKLLIVKGADIESRHHGSTPLNSAMGGLNPNLTYDIAKVLIENGAEVNPGGSDWTPLHSAAAFANTKTVQLLLSAGADINAGIGKGNTPLNAACRYRPKIKGGVIDLLHKNGAVRKHGKDNSYEYEPDLMKYSFFWEIILFFEKRRRG